MDELKYLYRYFGRLAGAKEGMGCLKKKKNDESEIFGSSFFKIPKSQFFISNINYDRSSFYYCPAKMVFDSSFKIYF